MKTKLLLEMLELTEKQAAALREDDYELMADVSNQLERVREEICEFDRTHQVENSIEDKEIILKIQELTGVNIQIGKRKLLALKDNLRRVRENKSGATAYTQGYEYDYPEAGLFFDKK